MKTPRAVSFALVLALTVADWALAASPGAGSTTAADRVAAARTAMQQNDPVAAATCLEGVPATPQAVELMSANVTNWARDDFPAAALWASQRPAAALQDTLLLAAAKGLAMRRPADAFKFAMTAVSQSAERDEALEMLTMMWASHDAEAALEAASAIRSEDLKTRLQISVVRVWASVDRDPPAARTWVLRQPQSGERERLVAAFARARAVEAPAEAAKLVLDEIAPGALRDGAFQDVLREWAPFDPTAVRSWIDHLSDPAARAWAKARLDHVLGSTSAQPRT